MVARADVLSSVQDPSNGRLPSRVSPAKELQADVAILQKAYETLHPGLYRYNTKAQMEEAFRVLSQEFEHDRSLAEAYLAFSLYLAKLKCSHSYANYYNQKKALQDSLFHAGRVPFHFRWLTDRMIVIRSFAEDRRLRVGTEVLSINGVPVKTILRTLMQVARADGSNDAKRVSSLEVRGADRWEAFDIYYPLFFPSSSSDFELRIRSTPAARITTISVGAQSDQQRLASMFTPPRSTDSSAPLWELMFPEAKTAFLRMPTWALYESKWDWKSFLAQSFQTIASRRTTDLIIDLRGNEGGLSVGDVILSHLVAHELPPENIVRRVRYRKVPDDLAPYLDTWDRSFFDWGEAAKEEGIGFFRLIKYDNDERGNVIKPIAPQFTGRVWVLVGAENSSATFEFAQAVQQNNLGKLVGQPTGGNQRGINGGAFFFLRLPNSGIEIDLPLIGQFPVGQLPDAGLLPDLKVTPSLNDIIRGRDSEFETVMAETHRRQRSRH